VSIIYRMRSQNSRLSVVDSFEFLVNGVHFDSQATGVRLGSPRAAKDWFFPSMPLAGGCVNHEPTVGGASVSRTTVRVASDATRSARVSVSTSTTTDCRGQDAEGVGRPASEPAPASGVPC